MIRDKLEQLRSHIAEICRECGRDPAEITLVGVTKFASAADIREALDAGLADIAENKVQAAKEKFPALGDVLSPVRKHMIGHLQTNKVKPALELFDMIQSVDSVRLARDIQKQAVAAGRLVEVLVQVDCAGEAQKFGVPQAQVMDLFDEIKAFDRLKVQGLMTIAPLVDDPAVLRRCFQDLRAVRERVSREFRGAPNVMLKELSMGMTHDYPWAIREGATMLRIGTAIFG